MTQRSIGNYEASWGEYGADEWSDAMVASMKLGGVDHLFFVPRPSGALPVQA